MTTVTAELTPDGWLDLKTGPAAAHRRRLTDADFQCFGDWSTRYHRALEHQHTKLRRVDSSEYAQPSICRPIMLKKYATGLDLLSNPSKGGHDFADSHYSRFRGQEISKYLWRNTNHKIRRW